jgi:hypothetical protein
MDEIDETPEHQQLAYRLRWIGVELHWPALVSASYLLNNVTRIYRFRELRAPSSLLRREWWVLIKNIARTIGALLGAYSGLTGAEGFEPRAGCQCRDCRKAR